MGLTVSDVKHRLNLNTALTYPLTQGLLFMSGGGSDEVVINMEVVWRSKIIL